MDIKETYYGALVDYRKHTVNQKDCTRQRKQIARSNAEIDEIEVFKNECEIDDDWIDAIEKGLDFIDKAIREERQFILTNGEVLPIEKVKNVSPESVEHLAKHSNLLTRKPKEGKDLIPDKLYTVERLTDYAVYENRFLYMLLCYLRDFISRRYDELVELTSTYDGKLKISKQIKSGSRKTAIEINLDETLKNDKYLFENNPAREKIKRIDLLLNAVLSFLAHPLMEAVSTAPMLKPPITETNVLKMNKNFKGAMQLYYFITAYDKRGYTVERVNKKVRPFKESVAEEMAEVVELCSFLTYEHGLGIVNYFKDEYDKELKRLAEEERLKKLEQLKALRRRITENGGDIEEYLLMLEQRNRVLEADSAQLIRVKAELSACTERLAELQTAYDEANAKVEGLTAELNEKTILIENIQSEHKAQLEKIALEHAEKITELQTKHDAEITALTKHHEDEIADLEKEYEEDIAGIKAAHNEEKANLQADFKAKVIAINNDFNAKMQTAQNEFDSKVNSMQAEHKSQIENLQKTQSEQISSMQSEHKSVCDNLSARLATTTEKCSNLEKDLEKQTNRAYIAEARVNALKKESGLYDGKEDYNSQFGFDELERQYNHFKALFKEQWKITKQQIRKKYLVITDKKANKPIDQTVSEQQTVTDTKEETTEIKTVETKENAQKNNE